MENEFKKIGLEDKNLEQAVGGQPPEQPSAPLFSYSFRCSNPKCEKYRICVSVPYSELKGSVPTCAKCGANLSPVANNGL